MRGWNSTSTIAYSLRRSFSLLNATSSDIALPRDGPVAVSSLADSGTVPQARAQWQLSIDCTAQFTGVFGMTFFVWDQSTKAVYDPIDVQIEWSCAVAGCSARCESSGKGKCQTLLGLCQCSDGYSGRYCGYKLGTSLTQSAGVPFLFDIDVLGNSTGQEWLVIADSRGVEYDYRYLSTWGYEEADDSVIKTRQLHVSKMMPTIMPPGKYKLTMYRDDRNHLMGSETLTILPWRNSSCTRSSDCGPESNCTNGSCACGGSRWGGRCERGCAAQQTVTDREGVIQSDVGASSVDDSAYSANTRCVWTIAPSGRRGTDWDYIHLKFEWAQFGPGDKLQVLYGKTLETAKLDETMSTPVSFVHYDDDRIYLRFLSDSESGGAGFRITFHTRKNSKNIIPLAVGVPAGVVGLVFK
eukprot:m51a1_g10892 hypothetical protein (411) ;mRNA; f:13703-16032